MNKWTKEIFDELKNLDKKVVIILVSVPLFQTISFYITSTVFFRSSISHLFQSESFFAIGEILNWVFGDIICFFIFPWLIIKFIFNEKLKLYGLLPGKFYFNWKVYSGIIIVIYLASWFVTSMESISFTHPVFFNAKNNWGLFFIFEALLLLYIFAWEFLWRGYMLFGLESKFGWYAIFIQTIPFVILHNGKPAIETFSSILGGILLGIIALKSRTFLYGVVLHFSLMFSIDLFSVLRFRSNEFGIGFDSFLNLIGK